MLRFSRSHGLGNDYLIIDGSRGGLTPTPEAVQLICDRHFGVGGDGILLHVPAKAADFGLRIFNPDGSEAEKSGNGLRIFAHYLWHGGHSQARTFSIEIFGGAYQAKALILDDGPGPTQVEVEMGAASFAPALVPCTLGGQEAVQVPLVVGEERFTITAVHVGNPHCVLFMDDLDGFDLAGLGPLIERHPAFPNRTNVQIAKVTGRHDVQVRIWERGAGITMASGSSACAVAAAAMRLGLAEGDITVHMPGGDLRVRVEAGFQLIQRGPVEAICSGILGDDLLRRVEALGGLAR